MSEIRVGLITVMSEDSTWPQEFVRKFELNHRDARAALQRLGFTVHTTDRLGRTFRDMASQASELRGQGIGVLVLYVPDWAYSSNAVVGGLNAGVPVIVWSDAHADQNGIVGGAIIRGALDEVGVKTRLVHGRPDDAKTMAKLATLCRGISCAVQLRNTKFGIGGSRSMGMYTAHVDPSELMRKFGVDIDGWEQMSLIHDARDISDDEVERAYRWAQKEFGSITAKPEVVREQLRMYIATKRLIREKQYDAFCVKCLPELPGCHTTFCMAIALLNDCSDHTGEKEPIVCGCEADVNGTLTMQLMKPLTGGPVMFTDVLKLDYEKNEIGMANCGSSATDFARSRKDVHWVPEGLLEFDWKMGGACPQYMTKAGRVTMARISRIDGEYVMLIAGGETVEYGRDKLRQINAQHPQSYVRMDADLEEVVQNLRCNHIHFVFGDFIDELVTACWVMDIRPIVLTHRGHGR